MKILIAYDGSASAEAALADLPRAGLPEQAAALAFCVADVLLPDPAEDEPARSPAEDFVAQSVWAARAFALREVKRAHTRAALAAERLRQLFPAWRVGAEAAADSPAWGVIKKADEWPADLIVAGTQGLDALSRLMLGSVSQEILYHARCSVRVARARERAGDSRRRLIIGADGSSDAAAALAEVTRRRWPEETEARILIALDTMIAAGKDPASPAAMRWVAADNEADRAWARERFAAALEGLHSAGLLASLVLKSGRPARALLEEAEAWEADAIFVGARGVRSSERFMLGRVAATVAARARCSVEVTRASESDREGDS